MITVSVLSDLIRKTILLPRVYIIYMYVDHYSGNKDGVLILIKGYSL